jgi:predicted ATPase/class 3 adenylate cyclase
VTRHLPPEPLPSNINAMSRPELPTGTVTFLFSDVEGSTRLLDELGSHEYATALAEHRQVMRNAFARHGGVEVDTQGDAFFAAFPTADGAVAAATDIQQALADGPVRVRIGLHTGAPYLAPEGYVGADVHRAARIAAAGHGGQVLISAATRSLVSANVTDLGEHRLKDLSAPERIYQVGSEQFPPLKSLRRTNIPVPPTAFVGREQELQELLRLLAGTRLLTLTGPGGTGKSRLALQAAGAAAERFPDGIYWVPLAALRDPRLVLEETARAVGAADGLVAHIADKAMLVVLDNFEHLMQAAGGLATLLAACPNLRLLVTSRELLRLPGEQAYPVPPLRAHDGRALFVARARASDPGFDASRRVDELCARLDNLPLALELAAARVRVLSTEELLDRLGQRLDLLKAGRTADPRQQTLRTTIEWSYDLLDEDERRLFVRLSVFHGGWTLDAAEQICDADLDILEALVDKSLVRHSGKRFAMLETIREYAAERFKDPEIRRRHAEYFLALAEDAAPHLLRGDPKLWLDRLGSDHDNLRAALDHLSDVGAGELEQRLAGALWRFWQRRGHFAEGRRRLERALRADERPTKARAWALFGAAVLIGDSRDNVSARLLFELALPIFEGVGDAHAAARARMNLGVMAVWVERDLVRARSLLEEAVRAFKELGDEDYIAVSMSRLAYTYEELGDLERARTLYEDVVRRAGAIGNVHVEAETIGSLAEIALVEGRIKEALPLLQRSTRMFAELGDPVFIASNLSRFARALVLTDRPVVAAQVLARAQATFDELGVNWFQRTNPETRAMIRARLGDEAYARASDEGAALTPEAAVALALDELARVPEERR